MQRPRSRTSRVQARRPRLLLEVRPQQRHERRLQPARRNETRVTQSELWASFRRVGRPPFETVRTRLGSMTYPQLISSAREGKACKGYRALRMRGVFQLPSPHDDATKHAPFKVSCGRQSADFDALLWMRSAEDLKSRDISKAELLALRIESCRAL